MLLILLLVRIHRDNWNYKIHSEKNMFSKPYITSLARWSIYSSLLYVIMSLCQYCNGSVTSAVKCKSNLPKCYIGDRSHCRMISRSLYRDCPRLDKSFVNSFYPSVRPVCSTGAWLDIAHRFSRKLSHAAVQKKFRTIYSLQNSFNYFFEELNERREQMRDKYVKMIKIWRTQFRWVRDVWASAFKFGNFNLPPHITRPDSGNCFVKCVRSYGALHWKCISIASRKFPSFSNTDRGACHTHYCGARVTSRCEYRTHTCGNGYICHRLTCTYVMYVSMNMNRTSWYLRRSLDNSVLNFRLTGERRNYPIQNAWAICLLSFSTNIIRVKLAIFFSIKNCTFSIYKNLRFCGYQKLL